MKNKIAFIAIATALAAGGALADKGGHGHGKGHGHKHGGKHAAKVHHDDRIAYAHAGPYAGAHCPPGLAKKNNGCLPPGQAKKRGLVVGQPLPPGVTYVPVQQNVLVTLPPVQPGYRYVRVGNDILLLQQGGLIANILAGLG
jgi:Ni/Co efflux regulator RcnB